MQEQNHAAILTSPQEIAALNHQISEWFLGHYIQLLCAIGVGVVLFFALLSFPFLSFPLDALPKIF
ncbi:hypothetical protein ZZ6_1342 [Zymomonas mobilis subsp. mobilis ATCC 29191]|uniref:hypothetical protein n=1 Tax=Zymomonas mobilis TaxID=542 RepID=UPI00026D85C0|nr:hypothetical protein [Zymomonas mobilis]AFN57208.1 hypothetical protein ZZ6_1342 [Zymomonas mobilis subsp. mobilis ATCC 29191]GEB88276.1 hypothetical protein ZMO01_16160 [Zymomonas mobilis subsp. mobilis]